MKEFNFDEKKAKLCKVVVSGKVFRFNPNTLLAKKACEKFVKCHKPFVNILDKKNITQKELDEMVVKSCALVRETVNHILGRGAYEKIFAGRTVDFEEHQNLMTYIFQSITEFDKVNIPNEPAA